MFVQQITPNISDIHISCGKSSCGGSFPLHLHAEAEFITVLSGKYICHADGNDYDVFPGETIMINRNVSHSTTIDPDTASVLVQIDIERFLSDAETRISHLSAFLNENKYPCYVFKNGCELTDVIKELIMNIKTEFYDSKTANDIFIRSDIYKIVALLYRNGIVEDYFSKINKNKLVRLMPVLLYIDKNYKNQITLEALGRIIHLNPDYLSRLFKGITGRNIFEYINFVRIYNAMSLLVKTDMTVLEVAYESGYSSISYFNRSFCKICGCTPTVYRKIKTSEVK